MHRSSRDNVDFCGWKEDEEQSWFTATLLPLVTCVGSAHLYVKSRQGKLHRSRKSPFNLFIRCKQRAYEIAYHVRGVQCPRWFLILAFTTARIQPII